MQLIYKTNIDHVITYKQALRWFSWSLRNLALLSILHNYDGFIEQTVIEEQNGVFDCLTYVNISFWMRNCTFYLTKNILTNRFIRG